MPLDTLSKQNETLSIHLIYDEQVVHSGKVAEDGFILYL